MTDLGGVSGKLEYDVVDWTMTALSFALIAAYHIHRFCLGGPRINQHQDTLWNPWSKIMESTSKNSITAVQMLRNTMEIHAFLGGSTVTAAMLLASLRESDLIDWIEMSIVIGCFGIAFLNFGLCCRFIHHIVFLISIYPEDLTLEGDEEIARYSSTNKLHIRRLLKLLSRHHMIGRRFMLVGIPLAFVLVSRIAMLGATLVSIAVWWYLDSGHGMFIRFHDVDTIYDSLAEDFNSPHEKYN